MTEQAQDRQPLLLGISNAMVKLYKEMFGRGPTRARTNFAGPDVVVCTLRDTLTPAERNLVKLGEHQRLRDIRMFFQYSSEAQLRGAVEELTGRKVVAFVSGLDTGEDVATEVFYLEPKNGGHRNDNH
ncbi:MAG: DUF2294 domain-containing protein [Thermoleophilaceae bacterium]